MLSCSCQEMCSFGCLATEPPNPIAHPSSPVQTLFLWGNLVFSFLYCQDTSVSAASAHSQCYKFLSCEGGHLGRRDISLPFLMISFVEWEGWELTEDVSLPVPSLDTLPKRNKLQQSHLSIGRRSAWLQQVIKGQLNSRMLTSGTERRRPGELDLCVT